MYAYSFRFDDDIPLLFSLIFCSYVRFFIFGIGGLLLLSSYIVLLCIGQHKSPSRQTGGISYGTLTFSPTNSVKFGKYGLTIKCILKSSISPRFHVPLGSITSNLLHHHQRILAYEHRVRKLPYN